MAYFTYILINEERTKTYSGHTDNLNRRLREHNSGKSKFSKNYSSWGIIHKEDFETLEQSIKREKYFKTAAGRRWIKKNIFK